jgi:MFS family permease
VLGPPLGGFITTVFDWRWIFWINIPIAVLGSVLVALYIPDVRIEGVPRFDTLGFVLLGPGLAASLTGLTLAGIGLAPVWLVAALTLAGVLLLIGYVQHAFGRADPLIDLRLLRLTTFRVSVTAGFVFRTGSGALPFLLPLMLQLGFGLTALQSGLLTFASGAGALGMKFVAQPILRRYGFRRVMSLNALIAAGFVLAPAFFTPATPWLVMILVLFVGWLSRSMQFTAIHAVAYADVPAPQLSSATSFQSVAQQLAGSLGITLAAFGLEAMQAITGGGALQIGHFPWVFALVAALPFLTAWPFSRLPESTGAEMLARPERA